MIARLAELAIAALDDPDALLVLEDYLLEHNPEDTEEHRSLLGPILFSTWPDSTYEVRFGGASNLYHWPVVARCWVNPFRYRAMYEWLDANGNQRAGWLGITQEEERGHHVLVGDMLARIQAASSGSGSGDT